MFSWFLDMARSLFRGPCPCTEWHLLICFLLLPWRGAVFCSFARKPKIPVIFALAAFQSRFNRPDTPMTDAKTHLSSAFQTWFDLYTWRFQRNLCILFSFIITEKLVLFLFLNTYIFPKIDFLFFIYLEAGW